VSTAEPTRPRVAFVLEQTLGHVTHTDNLRRLVPGSSAIEPTFDLIPFEVSGWRSRVPGWSNWTVRAGVRARRAIRARRNAEGIDALFVHTQVPAMLAVGWLRRIPSIVSLDATPRQYDEMGVHYQHEPGSARTEAVKSWFHRRAFVAATHVVSWSEYAKRDLVAGYGVSEERITVIPPGVDPAAWWQDAERPRPDDVVRILFVGGDLVRKGGDLLVDAMHDVRERATVDVELHLVTGADVPAAPGVVVHRGLTPNSEALIALYRDADIFCLPTRGDCLPMVLSEAGAAGLPLVSTDIGAIAEIVVDGETGVLVDVDDRAGLVDALVRLADDRSARRLLGTNAQRLVSERFDAAVNARRLAGLLADVADGRARRRALVTVSGTIPVTIRDDIAAARRPRIDYLELARELDADLLDHPTARATTNWIGRVLDRVGGGNAVLAWECLRRARRYDILLTDGEQVGLPYAALASLRRRSGLPRHSMIVHILSVPKKAWLFRALRLGRRIDALLTYASAQQRFAIDRLGMPGERVRLTSFTVDSAFFRPDAVTPSPRRMICSAGLEFRDYDTLVEAVDGLDVEVVIAAASPWSKRTSTVDDRPMPSNVTICKLSLFELRQLYADAAFVVMPLQPVEFQAGITTILEAMAMGKAVVCTRTPGQTDAIVDDVSGRYVPPGDADAMRRAIVALLDAPDEAARLGAAARDWVTSTAELSVYAARLARMARAQE
jgi:glycosyltransferase involved in cell wall biosynthesis